MSNASQLTRERIILVAESLFAQRGIGAVSAREIATAAGLRNNSSVQYHFGAMDGLLEAIVDYRMGQLELERSRRLARAEAAGAFDDVWTLMEIICLPHLTLRQGAGRFPYAGFLCQYLPRYHPKGFSWIMQGDNPQRPHLARTIRLLNRKLDYLPEAVMSRRLTTATLIFLNLLLAYETEPAVVLDDDEPVIRDALGQIVAGISVPWEGHGRPIE